MQIWTLTLKFVLVSMRTLTRGYNLFWLQVLTSFKLNSQFIGQYDLPAHSINRITSLLTCPLGQAQDFIGEYLLKCQLQSLPPRSPQSTGEEETHSSISNHATREAGSSILQDDRLLKTSKCLRPEWKRTSLQARASDWGSRDGFHMH